MPKGEVVSQGPLYFVNTEVGRKQVARSLVPLGHLTFANATVQPRGKAWGRDGIDSIHLDLCFSPYCCS